MSSSPGRLSTLVGAGIEPEILVPDIDEDAVRREAGQAATRVVTVIAAAKVAAVETALALPEPGEQVVVVAADTMLEIDGHLRGKPRTPEQAVAEFTMFSGRSATVHTGQHVVVLDGSERRETSAVSTTRIEFADLQAAEIEAYVATGEPLRIAGCAVEGIGGAFITAVHGDPHGVGGLSLPLFRRMVVGLGVEWQRLWNRASWIADSHPGTIPGR